MKKKTTEIFIEDAIKVHGDKYDYSLVEYIGTHKKVKIICKEHGVFEQSPQEHLKNYGCKFCYKLLLKYNFINKSNIIHNNKYDYSLVDYKYNDTKVKIICPIHGVFEQTPCGHSNGQGCKKCYIDNMKISLNDFINKSNIIHNNKYDYSLVNYINTNSKVKIICPIHGIFKQTPSCHSNGQGCSKCNGNCKLTNLEFIQKSKEIHSDKYDYSLVDYKGSKLKVKIICPIHGVFEQRPNDHLTNHGCPSCFSSKGEMKIKEILNKNNIKFEVQKIFNNCKYKRVLPFDFYLPKYNMCIEFDGSQHYILKKLWGGEKEFIKTQKRDQIKNEYCISNNIHLLRIKYDENIEEKLKEYLHF